MWLNINKTTLINLDLVTNIDKITIAESDFRMYNIRITFASIAASNNSSITLRFDTEGKRDEKFQEILEFISDYQKTLKLKDLTT